MAVVVTKVPGVDAIARLKGGSVRNGVISAVVLVISFVVLSITFGVREACAGVPVAKHDEITCSGQYVGKTITQRELAKILEMHDEWLSGKSEMGQANLCGADLAQVDLHNANLSQAILSGATLVGVNLDEANLSDADLSYANLNQARLRGAEIVRTQLKGAECYLTDLKWAIFEPLPGSLPAIYTLATAKDLDSLRWRMSSHALFELKDALRKAGIQDRQREVLYAIKKREMQERKLLDRWFNFVMFDLTSQYGMSPGRPLWILLGLGVLLSFVYMRALFQVGTAGIWAVWAQDRVLGRDTNEPPVRITSSYPFPGSPWCNSPLAPALKFARAWWVGFYFSVLSAFHLGWRDLNIGNWLTRLQPREYILRGTGWVRVVAGLQSVMSVYLLALWALTYFGSPFE